MSKQGEKNTIGEDIFIACLFGLAILVVFASIYSVVHIQKSDELERAVDINAISIDKVSNELFEVYTGYSKSDYFYWNDPEFTIRGKLDEALKKIDLLEEFLDVELIQEPKKTFYQHENN